MKELFLIIVYYIFFNNIIAQDSYEFVGALKLEKNDNSLISYKLNFKNKDGVIKGYSITDLHGPHETKNIITGNYDEITKKITIKETEIIYTKSTFNKENFCRIKLTSEIKLNDKLNKLEGGFTSAFINGDNCLAGTVSLINIKKIERIVNKVDKKIEKSKKAKALVQENKFNAGKLLDSLNTNNLTKNENLNLFWKSDEIKLSLWDVAKEDGDKINVFHNNKLILRDHIVSNNRHYQDVKLLEGDNVFKVVALNEGEISPNTSQIQFSEEGKDVDLSATLMKNEFATITIIKEVN